MSKKDKIFTNIKEFDNIADINVFIIDQLNNKKINVGVIYNLMRYLLSSNYTENKSWYNALRLYQFLLNNNQVKWRHSKIMLNYLIENDFMNVSQFFLKYVEAYIKPDNRMIEYLSEKIPSLLMYYLNKPIVLDCEGNYFEEHEFKKIKTNQTELMEKFINYIKIKGGNIKLPEFHKVITHVSSDTDLVIDGNNILLTKGGKITTETIKFFNQVLTNITSYKYLIFIHKRHYKILKGKISFDKIIFTPHGFDDDWFTVFTAIMKNCYIFSDDNYRDHIFNIDTCNKCDDLKIFLQDYQIKSDKDYTEILMPLSYSKVIQKINNNIYIPTINGFKQVSIC